MGFLDRGQAESIGFRYLGRDVRISDRAVLYEPELMSIGDHSRVDDFCVLSGDVTIGRNVHVTVFGNLLAGRSSIVLEDFATLAFGCHIIAQSDDYSGATMTNSTVPAKYKSEISAPVTVGRHAILGTGTVVLPGVHVAEGTSAGAHTVILHSTDPWSIYVGAPARKVKDRSRGLLALEQELLREEQ